MRRVLLALAVGALVVSTASTAPAIVIIIDDGPAGSPNTTDITWTPTSGAPDWNYRPESGSSAKPNSYNDTGSRFAYYDGHDGHTKTATYTPMIPREGLWRVSMWWPAYNWTENALVRLTHTGGTSDFRIDQGENSGQWNTVGYFDFAAGTGGSLMLSSEGALAGSSETGPVADAVRFDFAGGLLQAVDAKASSTIGGTRTPDRAIKGVGMSDANGDGIPDTHAASDYGNNYSWLSGTGDTTGWFAVDLGEGHELFQMELYNFNATGTNTTRGVRFADLYVSMLEDPGMSTLTPDFSDTAVWRLVAPDVEFTEAPGTSGYNTPDLLDLGGVWGRWLAVDIKQNWGYTSFVGISEIQLFGVRLPEPSTLVLAALGLLGMLFWRRRDGRR